MTKFERFYSVAYLLLGWLACRFLLFDLHGMKDWPNLLAIIGLVLVVVSLMKNYASVARTASLGYAVSFLISYLLRRNGVDAGGGATNNMWLIWTVSYILIIAYGIFMEYMRRKKNK